MTALCITTSSVLAAGKQDVQQLYGECKDTDVEEVFCIGYITGLAEQMRTNGFLLKQTGQEDARHRLSICTDASYGAMIQAFVRWAENHPEDWGMPRQLGVMYALRETWPCTPP